MKMIQKIRSPGFHEVLTLNEHPMMEMERAKPPSERSALCLPRPIAIPGVRGRCPRREDVGRVDDQACRPDRRIFTAVSHRGALPPGPSTDEDSRGAAIEQYPSGALLQGEESSIPPHSGELQREIFITYA